MAGVNLPAHFMIRPQVIVADAGALLSVVCQQYAPSAVVAEPR